MKMFFGAVVAAALFLAAPAMAEDLTFTFINASSSPVDGLYISHVGTNSWEENMMSGDSLDPGQSTSVVIADGRSTCEYDIKVTFEDGSHTDERDVDLCSLGAYTVHDAN